MCHEPEDTSVNRLCAAGNQRHFQARQTNQSSAFSPTLLWGRRWRSRMSGAVDTRGSRGKNFMPAIRQTPLIRLRHLLPSKSTRGEGARLKSMA
jgi:hypothetical protein